LKAIDGLRCQRNFRNQHDRCFPDIQSLLNGAHVHFGFAASRHSVQEKRFELGSHNRLHQLVEYRLLFIGEYLRRFRIPIRIAFID